MRTQPAKKMKHWNQSMRPSAWLVPLTGALPWVLAIIVPAIFGVSAVFNQSNAYVDVRPLGSLLLTSFAWALGIAIVAMIIGWAPGRIIARLQGRKTYALAMAMLLAPLCVPSYIVFWCWWQVWPPESALYRFAIEHDLVRLMRMATLALGLASWSWPIVSWCVAAMASSDSPRREELLELDGATFRERVVDRWRRDRRGLLIGGLIVALATMSNTTCFDLAEVFTFSNELRAIQAIGAPPGQIVIVSWPVIATAVIGALLLWSLLKPGVHDGPQHQGPRPGAQGLFFVALLWILSLLVPVALFIRNLEWPGPAQEFVSFYGRSVVHTVLLAAVAGAAAAIISAGFAFLALARTRPAGIAAALLATGWIIAAAIPATTLASMIAATYNNAQPVIGEVTIADMFYATPVALGLALLGRFAFIAALIGRAAGLSEAPELANLRALDDATGFSAILRTAWPRIAAAMAASFFIVTALSMSEITVVAQLYPPGFDALAPVILSAMHYQQPETVMLAALGLVVIALLAALTAGLSWMRLAPRRGIAVACVFASCCLLSACEVDPTRTDRVIDVERTFGTPGLSLGQFNYPRCIAADCEHGYIYVIDKTARVQRFNRAGEAQHSWRMPKHDNGKPTGMSVAPDGRVFIADTHEFRIFVCDSDGRELMQFGTYGTGEGEFIYTTDIAFGADGRIYVSEYGGNDRIQVFDPEGEYLFQIGGPGEEPGRFIRPQSMCFSRDGSELFVADSCNHRIQVFTADGEFKRAFGTMGKAAGQLAYPYGLDMLDDGSLLITEFGNNRVQRLGPNGELMGAWGTVGRGAGQLQYPWASAVCGDEVFVLDSGNNRVQVTELR